LVNSLFGDDIKHRASISKGAGGCVWHVSNEQVKRIDSAGSGG
jgi:hypothetical protein